MSDSSAPTQFLLRADLQGLFDQLSRRGFTLVGPRIDQGAIVYDTIERTDDLPEGWTDEQAPGKYRLTPRGDDSWFGYVVGPHSWKKYLFPPLQTVMTAKREGTEWRMLDPPRESPRFALIGARACELAAIAVQDRVFLNEHYVDPVYEERRRNLFIVAVQCTQAAETCFCSSMGTGPECRAGFDLALTELVEGFTVEVGSERGAEVAAHLPLRAAAAEELERAARHRARAAEQIVRTMPTEGLRELLHSRLEHPHWDDVAARCLGCTNCTMVCPTCFCCSVDEINDLVADEVRRERRWDSCFNFDFSHLGGGPVRDQVRSRYRQWLTHKLSSWVDQFGTSGCVGCGRCITWCPVGIDLTAEVAALREPPSDTAPATTAAGEARP